jgi:hypothetical protein
MTPAHAAALALTRALALLPRKLRWRALLAASAAVAPLLRSARAGSGELTVDGYREVALWRLMVAAGKAGVTFDPVLRHHAREVIDGALFGGTGALVVAPHSLLAYLDVRYFHDSGRDPVVITSAPDFPIFGTRTRPRVIPVSPATLAESVRHLRAGDLVCAMIDRPAAEKGTIEVATGLGPIHISTPILKFAVGARARIVFSTIRILGGEVHAHWSAPSEPATAESAAADFATFLQARIAEGHGRDGPRLALPAGGAGGEEG